MSFYPSEIERFFNAPTRAGRLANADATGIAASFDCGSVVRIEIVVDAATKTIADARFTTNGCGYAVAAAEIVATVLAGRKTTDFHGDAGGELASEIASRIGAERRSGNCSALAVDAARRALDEFRARLVSEFAGDDALICTCFGVGENEIAAAIDGGATTVGEVGVVCRAGQGCGSCRMLIEEMLDGAQY